MLACTITGLVGRTFPHLCHNEVDFVEIPANVGDIIHLHHPFEGIAIA